MEAGVYVMVGEISVAEEAATLRVGQLGVVNTSGIDDVKASMQKITLRNDGQSLAHVMVLGGAPAEGPLVFHGPFVMNSIEQIRNVEKAYMSGKMGSLAE